MAIAIATSGHGYVPIVGHEVSRFKVRHVESFGGLHENGCCSGGSVCRRHEAVGRRRGGDAAASVAAPRGLYAARGAASQWVASMPCGRLPLGYLPLGLLPSGRLPYGHLPSGHRRRALAVARRPPGGVERTGVRDSPGCRRQRHRDVFVARALEVAFRLTQLREPPPARLRDVAAAPRRQRVGGAIRIDAFLALSNHVVVVDKRDYARRRSGDVDYHQRPVQPLLPGCPRHGAVADLQKRSFAGIFVARDIRIACEEDKSRVCWHNITRCGGETHHLLVDRICNGLALVALLGPRLVE